METHKMQMYFPADLYLRLKALASAQKASIAGIVREAAELYCANLMKTASYGKDPLDRIVGQCHTKEKDLSERHDSYLYK